MGALNDWTVVDANNNAAPPDGWPENTMQYSEVNNTGRAVQGTMRRFFGDINGSLAAGGVADAYTVTLNETGYTAYFAGMYFAVEIMATNTGASTIDVNAIGVQSIVNRDGSALSAGQLTAGGIYEFRYDGTNFQLMGTVAGASLTANSLTLTSLDAVDLTDDLAPLLTGPGAGQHLEMDRNDIQSKSNATTASNLDLNRFGGVVNIGGQFAGAGEVNIYRNAVLNAGTQDSLFALYGPANADPTTPDALAVALSLRSQDDNEYGRIDFGSGDPGDMIIRCFAEGAAVGILVQQTAGGAVNAFAANENVTQLYHPVTDTAVVSTTSAGADLWGSLGNNPATGGVQDTLLELSNNSGIRAADLGFPGSADLRLYNRVHGGQVQLVAEDTAGSIIIGIAVDPDVDTLIRHPASDANRLGTVADGVDLLKDDNLDTGNLLLRGEHANGTSRFLLGLTGGVIDLRSLVHGANIAIRGEDAGGTLRSGIIIDPDNDVTLHDVGVAVARTLPGASGGLEVNNTLTGAGFERVLTTSDSGGGGNVSNTGTPVNNQLAIWTDATTIEGDTDLTYDSGLGRFIHQASVPQFIMDGTNGIAATEFYMQGPSTGIQWEHNHSGGQTNLYQTDGAFVQEDLILRHTRNNALGLYFNGALVAQTILAANGGFQVDDGLGMASVLADNNQLTIEGGQRFGGFHADGAGISTTTINNTNINDFNGRCLELSSGDTLRFGSISGASPSILDAGGTLEHFSGTATIGASSISVDIWEAQASGITYHNLSGTSTFTITGPAIGAWRYIGTAQVVGFVFAA